MNSKFKDIVRTGILFATLLVSMEILVVIYFQNKIFNSPPSSSNQNILFNIIIVTIFALFLILFVCYIYLNMIHTEYRNEKEKAKIAVDLSGLLHLKLKSDGSIYWCNDNFIRSMKSSKEELLEHKLSYFANITNDKLMACLESGDNFSVNLYNGQNILYVKWSIIKSKSLALGKWELIGFDRSEIISRDQKISQMDYQDELTGMYNTKKFLLEGSLLVQSDKEVQYTIICIAIKRFHELLSIRSSNGADEIIRVIADALKKANSIYPDIVTARSGTDSFILLIKGEGEACNDIFNKIILMIDQNLVRNKFGEEIRFSNGAAVYPKNGTFLENVLEKAELTLKNSTYRNNNELVYYNKDIINIILNNRILENKLLKAFELEEFELYYQAKVDIKTGKLIGREALMRWNDPKEGVVPPAEFIPLAEEIGLVKDIDDWGLREACIQNAFWHKSNIGPKVSVSVNICAEEFYNGDIVKRVKEALDESGLEPQYLDIEITESMTIVNIEDVTSKLRKLKELGVTISLDDFGTGYSSMSYLKILPIDVLKLDKSFIDDIENSRKSRSIAKAIIALGDSLGIKVLAEGIENKEQNDILIDMECSYGQGYYYGKPYSASHITKHNIN